MLPRSALRAVQRPLLRTSIAAPRTIQPVIAASQPAIQRRCASDEVSGPDPEMNGGYVNPPRVKRQHRDPYGDWWDKQDRRNYGEPVHEDNDVLGIFATEDYRHFSAGHAAALFMGFVASVYGLALVVGRYYPDRPSVPKVYPGGLETELGGPTAVRARKAGEDTWEVKLEVEGTNAGAGGPN